ncbi:hypothetical protein [Arcticibacter tournemirensis]
MAYQTIRTRDGEIKVEMNKTGQLKRPKDVPRWLNILAALSQILGSFGIVIAILQMQVSTNQFFESNRGRLIFKPIVIPRLYGDGSTDDDAQYSRYMSSINIAAEAENVGNTPMTFRIINFHYHRKDQIFADTSGSVLEENLYPTEKMDVKLATINLTTDGAFIHPKKINDLGLSGFYKIEYFDINNPNKTDTLTRQFHIIYDEQEDTLFLQYVPRIDHNDSPAAFK